MGSVSFIKTKNELQNKIVGNIAVVNTVTNYRIP
jgi:hypothetical protein